MESHALPPHQHQQHQQHAPPPPRYPTQPPPPLPPVVSPPYAFAPPPPPPQQQHVLPPPPLQHLSDAAAPPMPPSSESHASLPPHPHAHALVHPHPHSHSHSHPHSHSHSHPHPHSHSHSHSLPHLHHPVLPHHPAVPHQHPASQHAHLPHHALVSHHAPAPPPPQSYYESPDQKIARLEAALEAARYEIDRLRARLCDYEKERAKPDAPKVQSRYWTPSEHKRFLEALNKFGPKDVRAIASYVGSRNATQVRTHAQKYFLRVAREAKATGGGLVDGASALRDARKRSMSESDLARVGRAVATPPGSPTVRRDLPDDERERVPSFLPRASPPLLDAPMLDSVRPHSPPPPRGPPRSTAPVASPLATALRQSASLNALSASPPRSAGGESVSGSGAAGATAAAAGAPNGENMPSSTTVSASKPPVASPKLTDNSGINLLSLVASARDMETESPKASHIT